MTHDEAMEGLRARMAQADEVGGYTDAQLRAAMVLAMCEGADRITVRRMAEAVGLHLGSKD